MQKKRERIRFQQKNGRPPISREDADYWLAFLEKVLKVGTEFEMILPTAEKVLEVSNNQPCIHAKKPCVKNCANLEACLVDRHPSLCRTRITKHFLDNKFECPAKDDTDLGACEGCGGWALLCRKLECAMFVPFCTVCPSFQRKGEVVESGNIRQDAETVRNEMRQLLQPTEFVGQVGKTGVLEVKKDNSLPNGGGIEVPTVGRRIHWQSFYNMCKNIIEPIVERGGSVNERCGQHYHVLAGYLDNSRRGGPTKAVSELEKPLPECVLANLHQLHRRYELAMFWIMSAGNSMAHLTRWSRFRQSLRRFSALRSRMLKVQAEMAEVVIGMNSASNQKGKYASVAYHFCRFNPDGDVTTLHIENRIADGVLSPAVAAAWAMLCYALVLKAVRLSQYGIMEAGSQEYMDKVKAIQPHLIDGERREWGDYRNADTSKLAAHIPWLRENTTEMVNWLKPELSNLGPSYEILLSLADKPCSLRLAGGQTWENIENSLYGPHLNTSNPEDLLNEEELREIIDLASIVDCEHMEMWIEEVAAYLGKDPPVVADIAHRMVNSGDFRWSDPIGALITA